MFKKIISTSATLLIALHLAGCTSLLATATGSAPLGKPEGERTLSMRIEDSAIATTAEVNIYKASKDFRNANTNVISFYGSVLLAGQVQTEALKTLAEKTVRDIAEVKQVHNYLSVEEASYYFDRSKDGIISAKVRSALLFDKNFPSSRTKVLTVNGTVYLLGKLTHGEADYAVDAIKKVAGVTKIIKLIDYLAEPSVGNPA